MMNAVDLQRVKVDGQKTKMKLTHKKKKNFTDKHTNTTAGRKQNMPASPSSISFSFLSLFSYLSKYLIFPLWNINTLLSLITI
jgi:hypothetical protein